MTACDNNEDATHIGVNAEVLEINNFIKGMVVKGLDNNSILGDECYINCESPEVYFLNLDNTSGEVIDIQFEDLVVGDKITVDVKSVENKYALTSRVQLLTQRRGT